MSTKVRWSVVYEYVVSEVCVFVPDAGWTMDSVCDRDIVNLQTLSPTFENT